MKKDQKRKAATEQDMSTDDPPVKKVRTETTNQSSSDHASLANGDSATQGMGTEGSSGKKLKSSNYYLKISQQNASMQRPKLFLTMDNLKAGAKEIQTGETGQPENKMVPLFVQDLQHLLIYALQKGLHISGPRWCRLLRCGKVSSVVLIVFKDVSDADFQQHKDCFPFLDGTFQENLRTVMTNPCRYFSSFDMDMYAVPVTKTKRFWFLKRHGDECVHKGKAAVLDIPNWMAEEKGKGTEKHTPSKTQQPLTFDQATEKHHPLPGSKKAASGDTCSQLAAEIRGTEQQKQDGSDNLMAQSPLDSSSSHASVYEEQKPSKTQLLLTLDQMIEEQCPLPDDPRYSEFVMSKDQYAPVTANSHMFAVDCEMCLTSAQEHELTRVSIINEQDEVLYDELVKPHNRILNYLTKYSGITKTMLDPVTKRLEAVQKEIQSLLPADAILCGQSLQNDLRALKMFHPYVIDTSVIYNLSGNRKMKCGLRRLTLQFLGRVIQDSKDGHCSSEDAIATMDLVKLKLSQSLMFGDMCWGNKIMQAEITPACLHPPSKTARQSVDKEAKQTLNKEAKPGQKQISPHGSVMMCSLFVYLDYFHIPTCLVGREKFVSQYQEEPQLKCVQTECDKETSRKTEEISQNATFTWAELSSFADLLSAEETSGETGSVQEEESSEFTGKKRKVFKKLDKCLRKLVKNLPEKCLVAVAMTGKTSGEGQENAATFLHIT